MNRRLLAVTVVLLCAIIATATALTVKNMVRPKVAINATTTSAKSPASGDVHPSALAPAALKPQGQRPTTDDVADYVVYWHLFHHNNLLLKKAKETESLGQDGSFMREFYKNEAKLNDTQSLTFNEISAKCESDVKALDDEAKVIIAHFRAQHPGGVLQQGETLPPPPPALAALQQRRNDAILRARDRLQQQFGETAFANFQTFVQKRVASQIKRKPLNTLRPAMRNGEQRQPRGIPNKVQR